MLKPEPPRGRIRLGAAAVLSAALLSAAALAGHATAAQAATAPPAPGTPAPTASAPPAAVPAADPGWTAEAAMRFWTPERMTAATDPSGRTAPPAGLAATSPRPTTTGITAQHFKGLKSVGTIFSKDKGLKGHRCSASVVRSKGHNLILTAGHCVGANSMFVPRYDRTKSAAAQPYQVWAVDKWFRDKAATWDKAKSSDLDYAFASLKPNGRRNVQDLVGANALARTPGYANKVTVVGYPSLPHNPSDQAVRCPGIRTTALSGYYQMQIFCAGMWGGVSGGPFFSALDASGDTGTIIGNVGGFLAGGPDVPTTDPRYNEITYSPLHGDRFFRLYADAQQGRNPDYGPYRQPPLPYTMGSGPTWKHARLMASGDFQGTGHGDMLVVWSDGEVTLYDSDGRGLFTGERRLLPKNSTWTHAATLTAGDFTGSDRFDLLVRWSDGETTLYGDVGTKGLNWAGVQMSKPKSVWKDAVQIAAGRFSAATHVTDLIVRWVDGEVTLYTGVDSGTFGQEHQLKKKNATWKDATLLTGGDFSGTGTWDLMVRWTDGELDTYTGTGASGLGAERRVLNANALWKHDAVMTTGDFTGDHRTDDLVVRWSDGETTMYTDTAATRLGGEQTLVHAG
ncbi:trypsin-like serine protease [Streptomyces sp. LP11]|uniref:Trypsin-like serine protease n=1 Tax=Streptomyces pyxinicus TaxID=2970331 RepID=A0ABT2BBN1_9ACTN|nr:trypsin-like serine protease [Streptomyces sp. LP11]MCS0605924.1 trypsin-like serine protease [Streptomyces sp. LP11]